MHNPQVLARIAGVLYLALAVLGIFAQLVVRATVVVAGDAATTAANVVANESLVRWGLVADILMATVFVFLGLALQRLLYESNARLATAILVFVSAAAASILVNLAFHAGALIVATQPPFAGGNDELVLLMFELHSNGYVLGGILFGLWLLPVGLIALRSPLFHRGVGIVLISGAIAWILSTVLAFVPLEGLELVTTILTIPMLVAEFGLILYLLIVGVRSPREKVL
ncbi:MAG: DUF4386 domain-containing protein [Salinibacterium sp.]|nr:DUF4386 domain-containing protein [Salinibacterium sp.]